MPKRNRDYRAEEARRNALAKQRGFTTRAAERGAKKREDYKRAGFASHSDYIAKRRKAREWSEKYSQKSVSAFNPSFDAEMVAAFPFTELADKQSRHDAYIEKLARYLHTIAPGEYPDYDAEREFWSNY